ncbi:voltage-dependent calcium channel subunit alpha-2/delta-3 [Lingula anatina]|uniref:Voltage-dependent calcium channel subunit alpha-2/delta-3 n=1 Tax=Lingula anatina TaxID=7574 RepID=A0A1S3K2Z7_LINAN|nr:voltage-dependent calcium channel subunit alpha-2/delta-3 [Lingula anatina]|eukprot:XP_013417008.1 voltage-dependent calcium channel subunit alpha-2/delta-3 [Lingula anatina]
MKINRTAVFLCAVAQFFILSAVKSSESGSTVLQYCSFFNNRAPKPQPDLKNCTWYKENSCCLQREIDATFGKVKPLQGASKDCSDYINYLMCYICAPNQNLYYRIERLYVCEGFCDSLYSACNSAILKGSVIRDLYSNGKEFCESRRFIVRNASAESCFDLHESLVKSGSICHSNPSIIVVIITTFCGFLLTQFISVANSSESHFQFFNRRKASCDRQSSLEISNSREKEETFLCFKTRTKSLYCTLSLLLLFICGISANGADEANFASRAEHWAELLSQELHSLADKGLKANDAQKLYDNAEYHTKTINGTSILLKLKNKLESFFQKKKELAVKIAERITFLYDDWVNDKNNTIPKSLKDLSFEVFKDADSDKVFPREFVKYSRVFKAEVMMNSSVVKIPEKVNRNNPEVIGTVAWSAALDKLFIQNAQEDEDIRWQYFGSKLGVHRSFPGKESKRNFIGFQQDYDPRTRPWYIAATSGPKHMVIIMDVSSSMEENHRFSRMKATTKALINSMTMQDRLSIIASKSFYYTKDGKKMEHSPKVLGCVKDTLVPVSNSHKRELFAVIAGLKAEGGSDHRVAFQMAFSLLNNSKSGCQSFIVFITDGDDKDRDQRCKPGYYRYDSENKRYFVPGDFCIYHYRKLVVQVRGLKEEYTQQKPILFTILVSSVKDADLQRLACENDGSLMRVNSDYNLPEQLSDYFSHIEASSASHQAVWSSPYLDHDGLGLMVTVAVPVYSYFTDQFLGVVGIDFTLVTLEELVLLETWGTAYAFIVDVDAHAVVHPSMKSSTDLKDDPIFLKIWELEVNHLTEEFFAAALMMVGNETGDYRITNNAQRAYHVHGELIWKPTEYIHYFFTPLEGADFFLVLNLAKVDETFRYPEEPTNFVYSRVIPDKHVISAKNPVISLLDPPDPTSGLKNYSYIHMTKWSMCNLFDDDMEMHINASQLEQNLNAVDGVQGCPEGGIFRVGVRADVKITSRLESLWKARNTELQRQISSTYIATATGTMRIFPGDQIPSSYDPTRRLWYNLALVRPGSVVMSNIYRGIKEGHKIITLSKTVHSGKPTKPAECNTGKRRQDGCPCTNNADCGSEYCYNQSCANSDVVGVAGLDLLYVEFFKMVQNITKTGLNSDFCDRIYSCGTNKTCTTLCYLVNDEVQLILDSSFLTVPDYFETRYGEISLAERHGSVVQKLMQKKVVIPLTRTDFDAVCQRSNDIPEKTDFEDPSKRGPLPPFQNEYACIKARQKYHINGTALAEHGGKIVANLDNDPCADGTFVFVIIPNTNTYLLTIFNYWERKTVFNWNCHLLKSVFVPKSFEVTEGFCEQSDVAVRHNPIQLLTKECPVIKPVKPLCPAIISTASTLLSSLFMSLLMNLIWISLSN